MQPQALVSQTCLVVVPGNRDELEHNFEKFRSKHFAAGVNFLRRVFSDFGREECEDVMSEAVFLHWRRYLAKAGNEVEVPLSSSYLYRIAYNVSCSRLRRRSFRTLGFDDVRGPDGNALEIDGYSQSIDSFSLNISHFINALDPISREIIQLIADESMTYEEAAKHLGVRVGTIKSRYARARRALTEVMKRDSEVFEYVIQNTRALGSQRIAAIATR